MQTETRSVFDYIYSLSRKRDATKHIRNVTYGRGRMYFTDAERRQSTHTVASFTPETLNDRVKIDLVADDLLGFLNRWPSKLDDIASK